ncbi:prolyl oligopeptidase family serine peptidase [Luteimonas sp. M1R5S18]|uniref:Prolyl oligopeptidase family serine peptidase n=1 Tax=Luteimonas rhizosphaericola TaxID=3042024 RepID=A0ABT6JKB3_9GAMM|nr:prolyl oligopeptidase family serine peptidase [Luteimonas rhizosphaericola]MDH5830491.1 prolyl oligopeptidase family serine peptidase [Luteimonas rhizosphaericola]
MSKCFPAAAALALAIGLSAGTAHGNEENVVSDPHQWLEGVEDAKALDWVKAQNAKAEAELASTPQFAQLEAELLAIYDSDDKIPGVYKQGEWYYNFWKDKQNPRGLWRRTTLEEYRKPRPQWEVLIDLDALNKAEGENWIWHGADCLRPDYRRCLVALSRGGADADVTREFDLENKSWVEGGFFREEAKGALSWIDADTVYVYSDFGPGSLTESGYPRVVKRWQRGTPLVSAVPVYEGKPDDMYIAAMHDHTPGFERDFVSRTLAFYNDELYLVAADGALTKIDAPNSANKGVHRQWLTLELREPWEVAGRTYPAGSLLASDFDAFMAGEREFQVLFEPTDTTSLAGSSWTRNHLVLNVLEDVKSKLWVLTPGADGWARRPLAGLPEFGTVSASAVDDEESDALWLTVTDYLTPTTLMLGDAAPDAPAPEVLKTMPTFFDASKHVVEQHFATSKDGTRVPYFLVRPKDAKPDGRNPTLLYGYGGFEISLTPGYSGGVGKGWLEKGGTYAVANIRGGGEYGPRWHQAALKANRHKAYEDFAAVAQDLIDRKITSPAHLGIRGGSNGGLLTGNMLVQYPELFGAVVIQVPLLDMQRYNKLLAGASWMAEYGDPDKPEEWAFIRTFSPYHLFDPEQKYPPTILLTSTRDDRVHPGHARKMMAKMLESGQDVRYYENIEGGHGGAADNRQAAHMDALYLTFLWQQLAGEPGAPAPAP